MAYPAPSNENGLIGQTEGIPRVAIQGHGQGAGTGIGNVVNALNIGIEVGDHSGDAQLSVHFKGLPKNDIGFPGAIGAQLSGKFIHPPPPNPQASPSIRFCVASRSVSVDLSSNQILICHPSVFVLMNSLPTDDAIVVISVYAFCRSVRLIFSTLSGIPFPSGSARRSAIPSGSEADQNS